MAFKMKGSPMQRNFGIGKSHLKTMYDLKTGKFDDSDKEMIDYKAADAKYKHKNVDEGQAAALEAAENEKKRIIEQEKERQLGRTYGSDTVESFSPERKAEELSKYETTPEDYQANIDKGAISVTDARKNKYDTWDLPSERELGRGNYAHLDK
jgi:hypothetical protein